MRRSPVYGVLGNHDRYAIGRMLEDGVHMLVNEHVSERTGAIVPGGLDDCHYYESADVAAAEGMPARVQGLCVSFAGDVPACGRAG